MGMMQKIRDNTKYILWATVILFVLGFTVGGMIRGADIVGMITGERKKRNLAGSVNDNKLKSRRFVNMVNSQISNMRKSGRNINSQMYSRISDQVWEQFVNRTLMSEVIEEFGIEVTGDEIYNYLRNNPPRALRNQEVFQTDGEFDRRKYLRALNNPQGNEWYQVEQRVKQNLPYQKLNSLIQNMINIPEWEIKEEFIENNIEMSFEMLEIPISTISKEAISVTDKEISEYYRKNKEEYHVEETRTLDYVSFPIEPAQSDTQLTKEEAQNLKNRIQTQEDFQTVALEYSDAPNVDKNKGDLGWIDKDDKIPAFTEAAFSAEPGELVGPVESKYGFHLIQVEDKRVQDGKEEAKVKHLLLEIEPGPQTESDIESKANRFAFEANELGFEKAVDSLGYSIQQIEGIKENTRYLDKLGYFPRASRFAFSTNEKGKISDVYQADDAYVICRLSDIKEAHYQPLEEVRDEIRSELLSKKRMNKLKQKAEDLYENNPNIVSLKSLNTGNKYNYEIYKNETLGEITELNRKGNLKSALMKLDENDISGPIKSSNSYVLLKMKKREEFQEEVYKQQKQSIRKRLIRSKGQAFYNNWMSALKNDAEIYDNHMRFF